MIAALKGPLMRKVWNALLLLVGAAVVATAALVFAFVPSTQTATGPNPDAWRMAARFECQRAVRDSLNNPASAEWIGFERWPVAIRGEVFDPDAQWQVTATLRAENALGGTVRVQYLCDLRNLGAEREWRRVGLRQSF
jgi:hypothetical protein